MLSYCWVNWLVTVFVFCFLFLAHSGSATDKKFARFYRTQTGHRYNSGRFLPAPQYHKGKAAYPLGRYCNRLNISLTMGCGSSQPVPSPSSGPESNGGGAPVKATSAGDSRNIDYDLERAKQEEEGKIKMLLLGAGESGKSTIFKQMRLLYGTERSDDDLRMYGVVARSNIVVATRKLCSHLRNLGLEEELDRESRENEELEAGDHSSMTCRQAYDELMAYLVDNTATASAQDPSNGDSGGGAGGDGRDWVGQSPRAGLAANNDAKQFLEHHESIRILWQVSSRV